MVRRESVGLYRAYFFFFGFWFIRIGSSSIFRLMMGLFEVSLSLYVVLWPHHILVCLWQFLIPVVFVFICRSFSIVGSSSLLVLTGVVALVVVVIVVVLATGPVGDRAGFVSMPTELVGLPVVHCIMMMACRSINFLLG